jgi:hypothetical protein
LQNKKIASCRHKVIKFSGSINLVLAEDSATGVEVRTAAEREAEMAAEDVNNGKGNIDSAATSSTQTREEHKTNKRYIPDNSIASMLGEKLVTFTGSFQADVAQAPPKPASPEEILAALNKISGLEEDIFWQLMIFSYQMIASFGLLLRCQQK